MDYTKEIDTSDMHFLASEIEPEPMEWLWYPYIPEGEVTMLIGDGGLGKSLVMIDIIARMTKGLPMPSMIDANADSNADADSSTTADSTTQPQSIKTGHSAPRHVLYCTKENKATKVVVPRLIAAGADRSYVHLLKKNPELIIHGPYIPNMIRETNAKLCVIDPILSFVETAADIYNAAKLRRSIETYYEDVLEETGCSLVLIYHMTKDGKDPVKGAIGSVDNANFARSAMTALRFPDIPSTVIVLHSKSNCGPYGSTLAYHIADQSVQWFDREDIEENPMLVKYIQQFSLCESDLSIQTEQGNASQKMISLLSNGPMEQSLVKSEFMKEYSERTYFYIVNKLGLKKGKIDGVKTLSLP